jgi:hypothetical protein
MSLYDGFTSIAQGLSTWPMPANTPDVMFAKGTTFTCNFQGFFTQLGIGAPLYNCSLSFYYLLVIAFAMNENRVKKLERFMHLVPLAFSFGTAIAGLPLTLYNPTGLWCWIGALPETCIHGNQKEGTGECLRGHYAWIYRWAIYYGPVWLSILVITSNMAVVSYLVWAKERASRKFRFGHNNPPNLTASFADRHPSPGVGDSSGGNSRVKPTVIVRSRSFINRQKQKQGLASQVFWQAFFYVMAFYLTWITPTILRLLQTLDKNVPFALTMTMACLLPLQGEFVNGGHVLRGVFVTGEIQANSFAMLGFFNMLIYVRPRVVQYRNRNPERGVFSAINWACRRTITLVYVGESHDSTEVQDVEALDPCYALQEEIEEDEKRLSGHAQQRDNDHGNGTQYHRAARAYTDIRQLDEIKLLEEADPSFLEGRSEDLHLGIAEDDLGAGGRQIRGSLMAAGIITDGVYREDSSGHVVSVHLGRRLDISAHKDTVNGSEQLNPGTEAFTASKENAGD